MNLTFLKQPVFKTVLPVARHLGWAGIASLSLTLFCPVQANQTVQTTTVDTSPPVTYASEDWLSSNAEDWQAEFTRRDAELTAFLQDTDKTRAKIYGFKEGQDPALAWNWFNQHPIGFGGMPYVLLQTLLSLDPATETDPHLLALANIWKRKSLVPNEQGTDSYTLDHLGFGAHPGDYKEGVSLSPAQRVQKLPNGLVYDPTVEPTSKWFVDWRLKLMRDGFIGSLIKNHNPDYQPKLAELLVLARGSIRSKLHSSELDYEKDVAKMQEAPKTDAVFFACSACHQGRVIVDGALDSEGRITKPGKMKFLPGMPNTEVEAQYYSKLLMLTGISLLESGFSADATSLPNPDDLKPSKAAIIALMTRLLSRAIDEETVKTIYGSSPEQIKRAKLQTYWVAKDFPKYIGDLIGVGVKTQYIYYQVGQRYAYNQDNANKTSPKQVMPDVIGDRVGQMDAFGIASGLVALHTLRADNSYIKFLYEDNPNNPLFTGIDSVEGFSQAVTIDEAGPRIRNTIANWAPNVPGPVDIKSLNWSGHRDLANWDGNQGASARTLASGTSATGDPLKVNVRIHEPLNALINNMPPPPYPFAVNKAKALKGRAIFNGQGLPDTEACSSCHQPNKAEVYSAKAMGVDDNRSKVTSEVSRYGLAGLVMESCKIFIRKNPDNDWCLPRDKSGKVVTDWTESNDDYFKDTPKRVANGSNGYKADMLHGIWARAPYLHNGSVPTLGQLLCPDTRPKTFKRGILFYDQSLLGFEWMIEPQQRYSPYENYMVKTYDTTVFGRSAEGHSFGSSLCPDTEGLDPIKDRSEITKRVKASQISDLLEYLKTL